MNKIIIGTANFFNNYGLLNSNVKKYEVLKILKHSKKKNIIILTPLSLMMISRNFLMN